MVSSHSVPQGGDAISSHARLFTDVSVGDRVLHGKTKLPITIRYIGPLPPVSESTSTSSPTIHTQIWLGIEYDEPSRGKHSGTFKATSVFHTTQEGAGAFIRYAPGAIIFGPTFVQAVKERYGRLEEQELATGQNFDSAEQENVEVVNLGTLRIPVQAPNMGMVRKRLGNLNRIREMGLDGMWVSGMGGKEEQRIAVKRRLAGVRSLDLSKNLLSTWKDVFEIVTHLPGLKSLRLNQSRIPVSTLNTRNHSLRFESIVELHLDSSAIHWSDVRQIVCFFPHLQELHINHNPLFDNFSSADLNISSSNTITGQDFNSTSERLGTKDVIKVDGDSDVAGEVDANVIINNVWPKGLKSMSMARISRASWENDIVLGPGQISSLTHLDLSFTSISSIPYPSSPLTRTDPTNSTSPLSLPFSNLTSISFAPATFKSWTDISALDAWTQGNLERVRFSHLDQMKLEKEPEFGPEVPEGSRLGSTGSMNRFQEKRKGLTMSGDALLDRPGLIARLRNVKLLNLTPVTETERRDAEIGYIVQAEKWGVTCSQPGWERYDELVVNYGKRIVSKPKSSSLASKLITLYVHFSPSNPIDQEAQDDPFEIRALPSSKVVSLLKKIKSRLSSVSASPISSGTSLWTTRQVESSDQHVLSSSSGLKHLEKISELEGNDEVGTWVSDGDHLIFEHHSA